jgi:oligopeptide transport system ATP-binding protein
MDTKNEILRVENLKEYFRSGGHTVVKAVDGISFNIYEGETFGLVGESGCGKSTTGRTIIQLYKPTSGKVYFNGTDLSTIHGKKDWLKFRRNVQMIYQDPYASLNPRKKVRDIVAEGIKIHGLAKNKDDCDQQVNELLTTVGLNSDHANRYPHELSGGQRQRVGIARALSVRPKFIICDEPISALDVSIQAQIVNLLKRLQDEKHLTYLFIAHDLSMVKYISNRIGVMYQGKLVELGDAKEIYRFPMHPYTKSLLSAITLPDPDYERQRTRIVFDKLVQTETSKLRELVPGHYVYCDANEIFAYQRKYQSLQSDSIDDDYRHKSRQN